MRTMKSGIFVLAFCIATIFSSAQNNPGICHLGELKNDSLLPYVDSLQLDCSSGDLVKYKDHSSKLKSLTCLILNGDATPGEWNILFTDIKTRSSVKTIVFDENNFKSLPYGYEKLYNIENLTISNNDEIDYFKTIPQLAELLNLRELTLDIYTIFDLPDSLSLLKNINKIALINKDEAISENDSSLLFSTQQSVTYDYTINTGNDHSALLKYTTIAGALDSDEYQELSKRFKSTHNYSSALAGQSGNNFSPTYNYIKPPIKGLDVERNFYTINSEIDNVLLYPSGTKILIPANSFVDKNGKPVKGSVVVGYREFRDPVDFLVSGIPMKYDTAGMVNNFQSAGMFEITASIKDQPLTLASNKKIQMNFVSTSVDSTYNFYAFNDSTGNWNYKTKPKTVTQQSTILMPVLTPAYSSFQNFANNKRRVKDKTLFSNRFESMDYIYTSRIDSVHPKGRSVVYRVGRKDRYKPMSSLIRITRIRKTKAGEVLFKVRFMNEAHPEMSEFSNYYFALNEVTSVADFKQQFVHKKAYNDIRIYSKGSDFQLRLKGNKEFKNISAHLVAVDDNGIVKEIKNTKAIAKRYSRRLSNRERIFNKDVKKGKGYDDYIEITNPNDININAFKNSQPVMTVVEKKMSYEEWMTYTATLSEAQRQTLERQRQETEKVKQVINNSGATANNLVQSLSLDGMGIYNCDQIQRINDPVEIFAKYRNNKSQALSPSATYIIDKNINAVLQYDGYRGFDADKIAFSKSKNAENVMLAINVDGSIAIYRPEDFRKNIFKNKSKFEFVVTEINSNFTSVGDLKKIIGL